MPRCHKWFQDRNEVLFEDKYRPYDRILMWRRCFATTLSVRFLGEFIINAYHFRINEFESGNTTFKFRRAFTFHWERCVKRATRNNIFAYGIVRIFKTSLCVQRNICFMEMAVFAQGVTCEKRRVKFCTIKISITEKWLGIDWWMFEKEIF